MSDNERLREALGVICEMVPEASLFHLETSDQAMHGFVLRDITLANDNRLSQVDEGLLDRVTDEVWSQLSELAWDGVVGEDAQGYAVIRLATTCEWFALCGRPATGTTSHPVLGAVPTCDRCAKRARPEGED